MATKTINDLTALDPAYPNDADLLLIRDSSGPNDRKLLAGYLCKTTDGTECIVPTGLSGSIAMVAGAQTLTGKTLTTPTITLKQGAAPAPTAEGDIQWDTDGDFIVVGDGSGTAIIPSATSTHTFTNKTLTTPTIGDFTNATHDHADAAGGGNTLLVPTIASFANANHDHVDSAGGGTLAASVFSHDHTAAASGGRMAVLGPGYIPIWFGGEVDVSAFAHGDTYAYCMVAWIDFAKTYTAHNITLYAEYWTDTATDMAVYLVSGDSTSDTYIVGGDNEAPTTNAWTWQTYTQDVAGGSLAQHWVHVGGAATTKVRNAGIRIT